MRNINTIRNNTRRTIWVRVTQLHIARLTHVFYNSLVATSAWIKMFSSRFDKVKPSLVTKNVMTKATNPYNIKRSRIIFMMRLDFDFLVASLACCWFNYLTNSNGIINYASSQDFFISRRIVALFRTSKVFAWSFSLICERTINNFTTITASKIVAFLNHNHKEIIWEI